ncbi:MAG TPA: LuxR C-terminal-related transcriptional regulator [Vicinamibacterales bacterium]|nr:LuxR C-terminal-related transcriptional regulator [Vicinamibacterales bacterium]
MTAQPSPSVPATPGVVITSLLEQRRERAPDYGAEAEALVSILTVLGSAPESVLQQLVTVALRLCDADSAGMSLLRKTPAGDEEFYWPAIAGSWQTYIGGTTPRTDSPCGVVFDANAPQLVSHPERCYNYFATAEPPVVEGLLAPFYVDGKATGTVWVVSHDEDHKFDYEDLRRLQSIARCATGAYQIAMSLDSIGASRSAVSAVEAQLKQLEQRRDPGVADGHAPLSAREREVVRLVALGHTNQAIGESLGLSMKTVETYRARATDKLGVTTRADLVRFAVAQGWLG